MMQDSFAASLKEDARLKLQLLRRLSGGSFPRPSGSASIFLDALRGFAAFSVLLYHWRDAFFVRIGDWQARPVPLRFVYFVTSIGQQWVIVFFVMSGYLVGGNVLRSIGEGRWSWSDYLLARLTRLYIVLIPALLLGAALDWGGMHLAGAQVLYSGQTGIVSAQIDVHRSLSVHYFLTDLFFLQSIHPIGSNTMGMEGFFGIFGSNGALWSLCNEMWYYIAFPMLILAVRRNVRSRMRGLYVLLLALWLLIAGYRVALLAIPWLMGAALHFVPIETMPRLGPRVRTAIGCLVCALLFLSMSVYGTNPLAVSRNLVLGSSTSLVIFTALCFGGAQIPRWFSGLAHRAATSSYTLYLVHMPSLMFLKAVLHLPQEEPSWISLWPALSVLIAILIYAQVVYWLFEKRTDSVRRWLQPFVTGSADTKTSWR